MPRRKTCPNSYPISAEFEAPCIHYKNHKGMCETMFPDLLGRTSTVQWTTDYLEVASHITVDMEEDYEAMRGRA